MVVETPEGTLFLAGYGEGHPTLWQSGDGGATWTSVSVGTIPEGGRGNSDVDLALSADGTLYFVAMSYDRTAGEGTAISVGASHDKGATWTWTLLSKTRFDDRPWVEVTPDGTAHVIWNDGEGVRHATSRDRGRTWTERERIDTEGGSSHLAVGPNGEIAVRVTPLSASGNKFHPGVDRIAVSTDGGTTWRKQPAPVRRSWIFPMADDDPRPRWVEPLAWDARGTLYSLTTNEEGLWLARSTDRGATWSSWRIAQNADPMFYPYLAARGPGELAATWFSGTLKTLEAHVARIDLPPGNVPPRVSEAPPFQPDSWSLEPVPEGGSPIPDTAGEYLAVLFLKDGDLAVVSPIQNPSAKRFGFAWRRVRVE